MKNNVTVEFGHNPQHIKEVYLLDKNGKRIRPLRVRVLTVDSKWREHKSLLGTITVKKAVIAMEIVARKPLLEKIKEMVFKKRMKGV